MVFGSNVPEVTVTDVPSEGVLIDVREVDEWHYAHAPTAVLIPMSEITGRVAEVPSNETVYVICHSGGRSAQVVDWLNAQGFDTVNVAGGMVAWAGAGLPVESGA